MLGFKKVIKDRIYKLKMNSGDRMHNILYLTYQENPFIGNKAIIKTQVEELLIALSQNNKITWLMVYNSKINISINDLEEYALKLNQYGISFIVLELKEKNIYTAFYKIYHSIKQYLLKNKTDIIHCRGYIMTLIAILTKKSEKVIFDMRGVYPDEVKLNKKIPINYIEYFIWKLVESYNVNKSDVIVTVTDFFKEYVIKKYKCKKEKVEVIYNCVNIEKTFYSKEWRNIIRLQNKCENSLVVIFSGSILDKWQSFDKISQTYKLLDKEFKNTKFIILTKDNQVNFSKYGLKAEDIITKYVENYEVYKYLSASDIALLVRDESIINAVAFPVKFSEYMACGVPVIISQSMKGLCKIINDKGIIYQGNNSDFKKISKLKREECTQFAKDFLDTKRVAERYYSLYCELLKQR